MNLYEKYKNDLETQNFIYYCSTRLSCTKEDIEDAIIRIRKVMSLQDALNIFYGISNFKVFDEITKLND